LGHFLMRSMCLKEVSQRYSYLFIILVEDGGTFVGTSRQDPARVVRVHV
jgi:hypothetical protein